MIVGPRRLLLQVGQRVVIAFDIACGTCGACKREEYSACETTNDSKLTQSMYGHCPCAIFGYRCATHSYLCLPCDAAYSPMKSVCLPGSYPEDLISDF